jgi:hypothetical protein
MSDMVDVLHYFFETDSTSLVSGEQQEAQDSVRTAIYRTFYNTEYKYGTNKTKNNNLLPPEYDEFEDKESLPNAFDPLKGTTKSYTPSTSFDPELAKPFGSILDEPLK